jgi:deoxyribonucleoside regulator
MKKMASSTLTELDKESLLLRCVYLFYKDKTSMQTIGHKLGISRFRVSRYLKEAEEKRIVKIEINDDKLIYESLACDLQKKYGVGRVIIVPVTATMDEDLIRKMVGQKGAELLASARQDFTIGITWGRTIALMIESISESGLKVRRIAELTGGPGLVDAGMPTNTLAVFAKKLLTHCYQMPSPIIVSSVEIGRSLKLDKSIRTTLEMSKTSEIAICGISTLDKGSMLFRTGFIDEDDLTDLKEKGAVGSILGRFFDKDGQEIDSELKERVISIDFEDFRKIPERIILAGGWGKAECIRGLLRGGLVSTIITDNITASALA